MIKVKNLRKRFGSMEAVKDISFDVAKGEVLGFLGPNGAGKTTTMRMITGFLPPCSGSANVCGHDVVESPVAAKQQIGYLPENAPAYELLRAGHRVTVLERDDFPGGMASSWEVDGFWLDHGPHRFHSRDEELIVAILGRHSKARIRTPL